MDKNRISSVLKSLLVPIILVGFMIISGLIILKPKERQFFAELSASIDMMKALIEGSDNRDVFGIHTVIGLLRKVVAMKESRDFDKESIRHSMNSAGDVLLDWAVTREIGR